MAISALPDILEEWKDLIHPAALLLPRPSQDEYLDLKASIEARGVLQPLATYTDNAGEQWLLDGLSRLQIMVELNIPVITEGKWVVPTLPFSEEAGDDPYAIALGLNIARRHLSVEQKRQVVRDLREQRPDLTDRAVAKMAGVSAQLVGNVRRENEGEEGLHIDEAAEEPAETDEEDNETEEEVVEETGRRARGQPRLSPDERRQERERRNPAPAGEEAFHGKVLPNASKPARIAEAKRCIKHLRLEVDDLLPKSRRETMH